MGAIASVVSGSDKRERGQRWRGGNVHSIADWRIVLGTRQNTADGACGDIDDIVIEAAAVGEARRISGDEAETFCARKRRRSNAGVDPQQVRDGTGIGGSAA